MAASLKLLPGSTVRWRGRRYLIVDYESLDAIIARQPGKRRLERIPVNEAAPDHASHIVSAWTPDLASVPEEAWQKAVKRFKILKPLLNMGNSERTFAHIKKAARALGKHPATVYRWIENYGRSERLSVFLRKERSDRGARRLSNKVEKIIDAAIKKIYLTAERPDVAAVVEEANLQCFNCVNSLAHWQIITESESIKEPRGRSHSQSYSQIALLHSHLFLHDQLTFADISGTDTIGKRWPQKVKAELGRQK